MNIPMGERLSQANRAFAELYPGESGTRQPVHSVYGGAQLFKFDTCRKLGGMAQRALADFAPGPKELASAMGVSDKLAGVVHARVEEKLKREPIEDYRIDFEDGYGIRPDDEEDRATDTAAAELARAMAEGTL